MPNYPTEIFGIARDTTGLVPVLPDARVKDNVAEHMEIKDEAPTLSASTVSLEDLASWGALTTNTTDEVGDFATIDDGVSITVTGTTALAVLLDEIKSFYTVLDAASLAVSGALVGKVAGNETIGDIPIADVDHATGLRVGDTIKFNKAIGTTIAANTLYYVVDVDTDAIKVALTPNGSAVYYDGTKAVTTGVGGGMAVGTGSIVVVGHTFVANDPIKFNKTITNGGDCVITAGTTYYVKVAGVGTITISATSGGALLFPTIVPGTVVANTLVAKVIAVAASTQATKIEILKYIAEAESLKFNDFQKTAMELAFKLKRFSAAFSKLDANAVTTKSMYPSGGNPATGKKL